MPENHGWTHANDIDPIPGLSTGGSAVQWPMQYQLIDPTRADNTGYGSTGWYTVETDSAQWYGFKMTNKQGGGSYPDGAEFYRAMRLGPAGSYWAMRWCAITGSDYGKVEFHWGTPGLPNDSAPGTYGTGDEILAYLANPIDTDYIPAWYKTGIGSGQIMDFYSAGTVNNYNLGTWQQGIRIDPAAAENDTISADAVQEAGSGAWIFEGAGPGIWWLRVRVNGKNASSSGYKAALSSLTFSRITGDGYTAS